MRLESPLFIFPQNSFRRLFSEAEPGRCCGAPNWASALRQFCFQDKKLPQRLKAEQSEAQAARLEADAPSKQRNAQK